MFVDKYIKEARINICKKCEFYRNFLMLRKPIIKKGSRCGKCSCFLDAKASLTKEWFGECPLNKWEEKGL
tara:strand:- start:1772 stop:1981 length:210 start_codon:yes stop_codon:yes gene_type:complete